MAFCLTSDRPVQAGTRALDRDSAGGPGGSARRHDWFVAEAVARVFGARVSRRVAFNATAESAAGGGSLVYGMPLQVTRGWF